VNYKAFAGDIAPHFCSVVFDLKHTYITMQQSHVSKPENWNPFYKNQRVFIQNHIIDTVKVETETQSFIMFSDFNEQNSIVISVHNVQQMHEF
jgi:hypothetical protein